VRHATANIGFTFAQSEPKFARWLSAFALGLTLLTGARASHAGAAGVDEATPAQQRAVRNKLSEGQKLLKAGKIEQAITAFEAAWAVVRDPEARLMLARCYQNQGELLKAHASYSEAVTSAEAATRVDARHRETLRAAQRELAELEGVLAKLTIRLRYAPTGTTVTVDGEAVPESKLAQALLLPPGQVNVVATTTDGREASKAVTLTAGQDAKLELAFERDEQEPVDLPPTETSAAAAPAPINRQRLGAFVAGGVGLAGAAVFGVFGAMSNAKYEDLQDACENGICGPNEQDDIDAGKRYQTIANVGLAVGIVGLGASAALFALSSSSPPGADAAARLELGVGLGTVHVRGRFQ
jgi:tetratricopeptide (TPR) repeat protein